LTGTSIVRGVIQAILKYPVPLAEPYLKFYLLATIAAKHLAG